MFKSIKNGRIIAINESGDFPCLVYDSVSEDTEHTCEDYIQANGEYVLSTSEEAIGQKKEEVREVRNNYLVDFVDPYQLVIRWGELSETEQGYMKEYRQYLLDYTKEDGWWEQNPMTYEDWLVGHHPVTGE